MRCTPTEPTGQGFFHLALWMTPQSLKEPSPPSGHVQVAGNRWTREHGTWDKAKTTWISAWIVGVVGTRAVWNVSSSFAAPTLSQLASILL